MHRRSLRLAIVQPRLSNKINESIERAESLVREAASRGAELVCLPEMWMHQNPYAYLDEVLDSADEMVSMFRDVARELSVSMVPGAIYEERGGNLYIAAYVIGSDGRVIGRQDKVHLFRDERDIFRSGDKFEVFDLDGVKLGVMVCYDVAFPESARCLTLMGAELLLNPSRVVSEAIRPWHLYVRARCLENRMPVLAVNVYDDLHPGMSILAAPIRGPKDFFYPKILASTEKGEGILLSGVDVEYALDGRKDRLSRRVPAAYGCLVQDNV